MEELSIIIVTRDRHKQLESALISCSHIVKLKKEIIVIDQLDDIEVKMICSRYESKYFFCNTNSLSVARNFGLNQSSGEYVMFLDDDAVLSPKGVEFLNKKLKYFRDVVICANIKCLENSKFNFIKGHAKIKTGILRSSQITKMLSCGMLMPRTSVNKTCFDERFGVGSQFGAGEETDLLIRMSKRHEIVFIKEWEVLHPCNHLNLTYLLLFKKFFSYGQGIGALIAKHNNYYTFSEKFYYALGQTYPLIIGLLTLRFKISLKAIAIILGRLIGFIQFKKSKL